MKRMLHDHRVAKRINASEDSIVVSTVDSLQGSECDVMIISIARNTCNPFLADKNRLCVARKSYMHVISLSLDHDTHELEWYALSRRLSLLYMHSQFHVLDDAASSWGTREA